MSSEPHLQSKRPVSTLLAGPYGHPFHPMLVTVPIGAWVASLVFDIASHTVGDPAFLARGSMWLIALGVIGALAWTTFGLLLPVALLGFAMLARCIPVYRARSAADADSASTPVGDVPAERHFPVAVVLGHGLPAVATLVLALLSALRFGGS